MDSTTELMFQASLGAMACAVFPDNDEQRAYTVMACAAAGVDYVEALAEVALATHADLETCRYEFARSLLNEAHLYYVAQRAANPPKEPSR